MDDSDKEAARYLAMINKLSQLTFYSTADKHTASEMKSAVNQHVVAEKMTEMSRFTENGKHIVFYTKSAQDGQYYTEILMFVDSSTAEDSILFSLRGTIDINEIAFLSERLKLNGKESIQKAVKGIKK
jgi:hypothetical protein